MRPQEAAQALSLLINARQPVMLHGSPGIGKSQVVKQVAEKMKLKLIDLRLSQLDSADLRGIPTMVEGFTDWAIPKFLPNDPKSKGILFLDEINSAAQATQAAAYQLVLDRKLGDYTLPEGWTVIAAGNRLQDRAIVNQMSSALKNRFVHIDFEVSFDDWIDWAFKVGIDESIIAFLRFRPNFLDETMMLSTSEEGRQRLKNFNDVKAFATPRSWEFMNRVLTQKPERSLLSALAEGTVGPAASVSFLAFRDLYSELPDLDKVFAAPDKANVPSNPSVLYALATGLALRADKKNWGEGLTYMERLPGEYQVLYMQDLLRRPNTRSLITDKRFSAWAKQNPLFTSIGS